eukprot:12419299-Karenia_brevis.AAC.1
MAHSTHSTHMHPLNKSYHLHTPTHDQMPPLHIPLPQAPPTPLTDLDLQHPNTPQQLITHILELNKTITDQ